LTVALLVACSICYRFWRSRSEELPHLVAIGKLEGIPALQEGKFDKAYQLLSEAKDAVDSLGGADEDAERIRDAALQASIFVDLIPDTLESLLEEAGRTSRQAWATRFDTLYKGHAVIIEAQIRSTPDTEARRYDLDYRVFPPGEQAAFRDQNPRHARIDLTGFEAVTPEHKVGDHVVFGARLASFQFDADNDEWVIGLEPKTGVSITYYKALETLGWPNPSLLDESHAGGEGP
jgi:hypothetical protein